MLYPYEPNGESVYAKARKTGQKASHSALQRKENPYLEVLDELAPDHLSYPHVNLELITIPMDRIAGTVSHGRTSAFANNFMPLLDENSEFAQKWMNLYRSVHESGIREPVKALEYMNKYYIIEGNKRVSVAKYMNYAIIEGNVTRVVPKRTTEKENIIYFEYLDFYKDTRINDIWFTEVGSFPRLYELTGKTPGVAWTPEELARFRANYIRFCEAFDLMGGDLLKITAGDAFLLYLKVYGYGDEAFGAELRGNLNLLRDELYTLSREEPISLLMSADGQKPGLLSQFIHTSPQKLRVAFVNNHSPQTSGWTYWHELGKNRIETVFGSKIETRMISNVAPEKCESTIETLIEDDANIIFTTSPILLSGAIKAAIQYPDVKILNCSLLPSYHAVRSYYLRMYEAKFIIGAIAGALSENDRIGYVADYPVYGVTASINAFALGARLTNPRAKVYLEWSTVKDSDPSAAFAANDVRVISNRDISAPSYQSMEFGLYAQMRSGTRNLAMPVWNWGRLYEDLIRRIRSGMWRTDSQNGAQAMNYWWGMDAHAIDVFYTNKLDSGTRRLTDLLRSQLQSGSLKPFSETILSQDGQMRCGPGDMLTPAEIISMDWLADNIIGTIPDSGNLKPEALPFVELQGIRSVKAPDLSEIGWTEPPCDGE